MFPDPAAIGTRRYRGLGNGRGLATVAPHNQHTIQFYERTNGTASFSGRVGLTVQPEMADGPRLGLQLEKRASYRSLIREPWPSHE